MTKPPGPNDTADPAALLRPLCMALPEVTEKLSHGAPTCFVKKTFLTYPGRHHGDPRDAMWFAAAPGVQEQLIDSEPDRFFRPAYVGGRGWVAYDFSAGDVDIDELHAIVTDAYRVIAPKRLLAVLDDNT